MQQPQNTYQSFQLSPNTTPIPQIGFGTYELKNEQCYESVLEALKQGYRHIDTASIYKNEEYVGKAIATFLDQNKNISRNDLFITSKISPAEQGYEKSKTAIQNILKRLQLDYLDLILIHWPGVKKQAPESEKNVAGRLETWKAFIEAKEQKLVKNIGVSNFLQRHLESLQQISKEWPSVNQFELHPLLLNQQLVDFCKKNNIIVEAYSSMARQDPKLYQNPKFLEICKKYENKTLQQICLRWAIQKGYVVIPKSKTPKYIAQNFDIFNFEITEEDMKAIDSLDENYHTCWNPEKVY